MSAIPRIVITPGEPAGIGPDITAQIAQLNWDAELMVVADPELLIHRAKKLALPLSLSPVDFTKPASLHQPGHLFVAPVAMNAKAEAGKLNSMNSAYVLQCLELATQFCLEKKTQALVTGPIHKSIMNEAGIQFSGHTEFLAEQCHAANPIMLFVVDNLKVALATTHLPLSQVSQAISKEKLVSLLINLNTELKNKFGISQPNILVTGLNPHAGESGHLGREEIDTIIPAIETARAHNINVSGPLPADTIFTPKYLNSADVILGMYHDQVLPVVKFLGFDRAINVTLGLPIIRTSVDHGTALDLAGTGKANPNSLIAAIKFSIELVIAKQKLRSKG